jgi:hypothetical protein
MAGARVAPALWPARPSKGIGPATEKETEMRIPELKTAIGDCLDANQPVYVEGAPGIGKSEAVKQLATERGARVVDVRLSMFDPVDLRGLPAIVDGLTKWMRPQIWPVASDGPAFLFFDEMDRAPLAVLNAALQIVLDRRIGEHVLPDSVRIIAAGNGATDRGTNKLPGATANRFLHLTAEFDPAAMREHFNAIGVHPLIVAFNHLRPDTGYAQPAAGEKAFATPRQWERVNRFLDLPAARRRPLIAGLVGAAISGEFEAFFDLFSKLPSIPSILANPAGAPLPNEPSQFYAVAVALARAATKANFAAVATYLARLPKEFETMGILDATKRDAALKETASYVAWAVANQDVHA